MSRHAVRALQGQPTEEPDALLLRGKEIAVRTEPSIPVQTDGEPAGRTPLCCTVKPGALRLLTPESAPESLLTSQGPKLLSNVS